MKHRLLAALAVAVLIAGLVWLATAEKENDNMSSILGGASRAGGAIGGGSGFAGGRSGDLSGRGGDRDFSNRLIRRPDVRKDPLNKGLAGRVAAQVPFDVEKFFNTMDAADALSMVLQTNLGPLGLIGGMTYAALDYFAKGGRADWSGQGVEDYGRATMETGGSVGERKPVAPKAEEKPAEPEPAPQEVKPEPEGQPQAIKGSLGGRDAAIRAQAARSGGPRTAGSPLGIDTVAPTKRKRLLGN